MAVSSSFEWATQPRFSGDLANRDEHGKYAAKQEHRHPETSLFLAARDAVHSETQSKQPDKSPVDHPVEPSVEQWFQEAGLGQIMPGLGNINAKRDCAGDSKSDWQLARMPTTEGILTHRSAKNEGRLKESDASQNKNQQESRNLDGVHLPILGTAGKFKSPPNDFIQECVARHRLGLEVKCGADQFGLARVLLGNLSGQ